jgi:hypothetical protein
LLALGEVATRASKQPESFLESTQKGIRGKRLDSCGGEFECKRESIDSAADLEHRANVFGLKAESRVHRFGTINEEADGFELICLSDRNCCPGTWQRQRVNRNFVFAAYFQWFATGGEYDQSKAGLEQRSDDWCRIDNVLEVIEYEQHFLILNAIRDPRFE